ncbi:MAG: LPS export ABC transporter periplasmic protein LptC [Candidatus Neomarinimicrobiota bacterium]
MILFPLIVIVLLFSCTNQQSNEDLISREGLPDQESWGVNIILTDQGTMRAKVQSGHLEKYNEKEFIFLNNNVIVDFFDVNENHTSILTSFQAEVDQKSNDMKAIGDVVVVSDSGITLYSETLIWESRDEKLRTKDKIIITTLENDTLYGVGFESDSDLKNWKIINPSGVTGREFK